MKSQWRALHFSFRSLIAFFFWVNASSSLAAGNNVDGAWSTLENWPLIAVHGAITPDARVLSYGTKSNGQQTGYFIYDIWDPAAGLGGGHVTLDNLTLTDIFCSSQIILPQSGDILIVGGDNWTGTGTTNTGNNNSNIFDYTNNSLQRPINGDINRERWYSSSTALVNGEIYIQGGNGGGDLPEVREISEGFRLLSGASTSNLATVFPRNFLAPDGRIFGYDTNGKMYFVDTDGFGSIASAGQFSSSYVGWESSAAMFRPGLILQVGSNSNGVVVIDINGPTPVVTPTQSISSQRRWVSATVLVDGKVLATGGSSVANELTNVNNSAEIWDPATGQWHVGSSGAVARLYHSSALLLPDATVLVAGGGAPGPLNNTNAEIYYPPYLFAPDGEFASRPQILSALDEADVGDTLSVQVDTASISRVTMVKTGSVTHSVNMDQRFVELPFTANGSMLNVSLPERASDTPPGYYMLFVIDAAGVPSVANMLRINIDSTPNIAVDYTPTIGGGGGGAFRLECNANEILVGIHGKTETYVNQIGPQCVSMDQLGRWIGDPVTRPVTGTKTSGTNFSKTCPRDFAVSGFEGSSGSYLNQVNIECKALTPTGDLNGAGQLQGAVGSGGNPQGLQSCGTGNPVYALYGRSGSWLDNFGLLCRQGVITPISINSTPVVVNPGSQLDFIGLPVELQIGGSDGDGDELVFSATGLPPGLSMDTSTGLITGIPTNVGTFNPQLGVSDGIEFVNTSFEWSISILPLSVDPIVPQSSQEIGNEAIYTASINGGDNVVYKWNFGDGTPETAYSSSATIAHTFTSPGIYHITLTANDNVGVPVIQSFIQTIHLPLTADSPANSTNITIETPLSGNARLWVINQDNDSVSVFDTQDYTRLAEIPVGAGPRSLAVAPDGRVWVTNKYSSNISIIDPLALAVVQTLALPYASQPFGLVFSPVANEAYVVLEGAASLLKLDASSGAQLASLATGQHPRHLSINSTGDLVYVSLFITPPQMGEATATINTTVGGGEIQVFDSGAMNYIKTIVLQHSDDVDAENQGRGVPNYLGAMVISPDGTHARVPSKKDNIARGELRNPPLNLNFQNTVRAISSSIELDTNEEVYANRIDYDNSGVASAVLFEPNGNYIFVALETSREVAIVNAYDASLLFRVDVGLAPQGLAISPDGMTLYVNNFMDRTVEVLDLTTLQTSGQWNISSLAILPTVASEKLSPEVLLGKQLFYDARDTRLAFDAYISCASCHNDGSHDGRVWDLTGMGEGLRNTITLRGRAGGQGSLHWTQNFDEVQDFEGQIRTLASGTGLMSNTDFLTGTRSESLGDPKAGISPDLDALAAYVSSLDQFANSPYRNNDGSLTSDAIAGSEIFQSQNCASCHSGPGFTDSGSTNLHDIGTLKASSGNRLGGLLAGIDTPSLRGIWSTAPYLHDGSALTLADAVQAHDGVSLAAGELLQLVAYLQQIDGQQSLPPLAKSAGLLAFWSMTEAVGATTADASGNGYTGSLVNGTQWTTDPGLWFDGVDDYIEAGPLDLTGTALTLSAKVHPGELQNCLGPNDCLIISSIDNSAPGDLQFALSTTRQSGEARLSFQLKTDLMTTTLIASSGGLVNNQWTHVAAVYDGAYMRVYVNGVEVGAVATNGNLPSNNSAPLRIGANTIIPASSGWTGQIDEVRIYTRALTAQEVGNLAVDNRFPVSNSQNLNANEDTAYAIVLTASDADEDVLSFSVTNGPSYGVLSGSVPNLVYIPNPDFSGSDSFDYEVIDSNGGIVSATIVIDVQAVNDPPVASAAAVVTEENVAVALILQATDSDGDSISFNILSEPSYGVLSGTGANLTYTPNSGFIGSDSFDFEASDGNGETNSATISISVTPNNRHTGDLNGDGKSDLIDLLLMQRYLVRLNTLSQEELERADIYPPGGGDGSVDISDMLLLLRMSLEGAQ